MSSRRPNLLEVVISFQPRRRLSPDELALSSLEVEFLSYTTRCEGQKTGLFLNQS